MTTQARLNAEAKRLSKLLEEHDLKIVFAESCTGGLISATLTRIPGISAYHCGSAVVYQEATKTGWLGVPRTMLDEHGGALKEATPARPIQVMGLSSVPEAGQLMHAVENERAAKQVAEHRVAEQRQPSADVRPKLSLDEIFARAQAGESYELPVVLKADTHGSVEAVRDTLVKLSTDAVKLNVIHAGVGAVNESDVMLARASEAIIVGDNIDDGETIQFHLRDASTAKEDLEMMLNSS